MADLGRALSSEYLVSQPQSYSALTNRLPTFTTNRCALATHSQACDRCHSLTDCLCSGPSTSSTDSRTCMLPRSILWLDSLFSACLRRKRFVLCIPRDLTTIRAQMGYSSVHARLLKGAHARRQGSLCGYPNQEVHEVCWCSKFRRSWQLIYAPLVYPHQCWVVARFARGSHLIRCERC